MKGLSLFFFLSFFTLPTQAQVDQAKIDSQDLKTFVTLLAADSLEGRGTGSEGQKKAERFIVHRFQQLGLAPHREGSYLEKFKLHQSHWGKVYIKTQRSTLENFESMVFQGSNAQNEEIEKEVVFGGRGTADELNQIDVRDKLVLVFVKNLRAGYDINVRLGHRKAAGLILANPENEKQFESIKNTWRHYTLRKSVWLPDHDSMQSVFAKWDTVRPINTITIPNAEIRNVSGYSPRQLTKLVDEKRIKDATPGKIKVQFERIESEIETANVVGIINGKSDKSIVISAHYDHLGRSGRTYFPGADDNASGTAALLEIAEAFSRSDNLEYNIVFLATSGEEAGLLGSLYHVNQPGFKPENILCNINLDMLARSDDQHRSNKYLYCIGTDQSAELDSLVKKADSLFDKCSFDYALNNSSDAAGIFSRSDQYNFYKKGIPSIHFFSGLHKDYHQPTDTADKIDYENLESRVRQISLIIEVLQKAGLKNSKALKRS